MPRSVRFHPLAAQEAAEVSDWYRERSQQAAIGFVAELEHAIQQVTELPETWPSYEAGTRRYVFSVYPYSLIYRVTEQEITIVAVAHAKRKPGYWRNRE
jgi:plasmid stabilization system protein ParE